MHLVAIAWIYVVMMMAVAEANSPNGTVIGAVLTFLLYGVLPLTVVMYLLATPARRRARRAGEAAAAAASPAIDEAPASGLPPDGGDHAAGDAVAPERKEP